MTPMPPPLRPAFLRPRPWRSVAAQLALGLCAAGALAPTGAGAQTPAHAAASTPAMPPAMAPAGPALPHDATAAGPQTQKKECSVEAVKKDLGTRSPTLLAALKRVFSANCSTFENVLQRLTASKSDAGRKLEPKRPLDRAAAQAQLAQAHADPTFQRALAAETEGVSDPVLRKLLEAALLEDHEYLKARDLLILEVQQATAAGSAS